jgi:copper/silver efflux system protein
MHERMKILVPLALLCVVVLLYLQFKNFSEVLIVLLSVPFALVGSIWALFLLDYHLSTAVWVGIIALVGLATQTGVVMIVYIDNAFEKRKRAGEINSLEDIIVAHTEGTILRVRPKLMTVGTMLIGLIPLLWSQGSGADVMKRIAAPMVGGLLTSAFLTLEIIPVIYTYWRYEQLIHQRIEAFSHEMLQELQRLLWIVKGGGGVLLAAVALWIYVPEAKPASISAMAAGISAMGMGCIAYVWARQRFLAVLAEPLASQKS